jgi:hypothetical protein
MILGKGRVVQFEYDGGSSPGKTRTVEIERYDNIYIEGKDQDIDQFRRFKRNWIRNLRAPLYKYSPMTQFQTKAEQKREIEDIYQNHPKIAARIGSDLIKEFNKKWSENLSIKNGKLVQPIVNGTATLDKNNKSLTINIDGQVIVLDPYHLGLNGRIETQRNLIAQLVN